LEFTALPLIAEVGAALAGFATLSGVIRGDVLDSDALFDAVLNSLIAVFFSLLALLFGSLGADGLGLRIVAVALLLTSALSLTRSLRVTRAAASNETLEFDRVSRIIGYLTLLSMLAVPPLALTVAAGLFPAHAALLFESAVFGNLVAGILALLYVVWRNLAIPLAPPPA